jgi:hypothetical protein
MMGSEVVFVPRQASINPDKNGNPLSPDI